MKTVFADSFYWIALINSGDDWHRITISITQTLRPFKIITIEEVLIEVLNFFSTLGNLRRKQAVELIESLLSNPSVQVIQQSHESFIAGIELYKNRLDKGYSITDCISMNTMRQLGITEILTHDHHFTQEGFIILFLNRT